MRIVTADQMREIDKRTIHDIGIPSLVLMERAGEAVADIIENNLDKSRVVVLSGGGNNGGDGIVIARVLQNRGWDTKVLLFSRRKRISHDCLSQYNVARKMGMNIELRERIKQSDLSNTVIVDALVGTGLNKEITGVLRNVIAAVNRSESTVVSVDIPSGISSDTGQLFGKAVEADFTVTFGLPKIGHYIHPGAAHTGKLFINDIGFPRELTESDALTHNLTDTYFVGKHIRKRHPDTHKGSYGYAFVAAGSPGKTGAAMLASHACMRSGVGAVTLGVPDSIFDVIQARALEEMTLSLPSGEGGAFAATASQKALNFIHDWADAVLVGPGIGLNKQVSSFVEDMVLHTDRPLVLDADGLNCLQGKTGILKKAPAEIIITPHPNEMKRLLSRNRQRITAVDINRRRVEIAKSFALEHGVVCVLKGAPTVIASPDGTVFINTTGNPGMATAGSGDVLSGIIVALLAQGYSALQGAVCGVYLHGLAGDAAREEVGEFSLTAGDLIEYLPDAFLEVVERER